MPFWCSNGGAFQERKKADEFIQLATNPAGGRVGAVKEKKEKKKKTDEHCINQIASYPTIYMTYHLQAFETLEEV